MWTVFVFALAILASVTPTPAHDAPHHPAKQQRLPKIAPAPAFALTSQDGTRVSLAERPVASIQLSEHVTRMPAVPETSCEARNVYLRACFDPRDHVRRHARRRQDG